MTMGGHTCTPVGRLLGCCTGCLAAGSTPLCSLQHDSLNLSCSPSSSRLLSHTLFVEFQRLFCNRLYARITCVARARPCLACAAARRRVHGDAPVEVSKEYTERSLATVTTIIVSVTQVFGGAAQAACGEAHTISRTSTPCHNHVQQVLFLSRVTRTCCRNGAAASRARAPWPVNALWPVAAPPGPRTPAGGSRQPALGQGKVDRWSLSLISLVPLHRVLLSIL